MRVLSALVFSLALFVSVPVSAQAATPCDGAASPDFFVLAPGAVGVNFYFEYAPTDHAGITQYTLKLYREGQTTALSTQVVMASSVGVLGPVLGKSTTCYSLPVVPVSQLPRGVRLVAKVSAQGTDAALASEESNATAPFGQRLLPPALRAKP